MAETAVVDFGGQLTDLIRRVCEEDLNYRDVEVIDYEYFSYGDYESVILSGGPRSVSEDGYSFDLDSLNCPALGICYGHQLIAHEKGGEVVEGEGSQYGNPFIEVTQESQLFESVLEEGESSQVLMSHKDTVEEVPEGFEVTALSESVGHEKEIIAAMENPGEQLYGVQFHPEAIQTVKGPEIIANFLETAGIDTELEQ